MKIGDLVFADRRKYSKWSDIPMEIKKIEGTFFITKHLEHGIGGFIASELKIVKDENIRKMYEELKKLYQKVDALKQKQTKAFYDDNS